MTIVRMTNWDFEFRHDSPMEVALGTERPPEIFTFGSATDLANHLATSPVDDYGRLQSAINQRLAADADVVALRKNRALLRDLPHFRKYRGRKFDHYHAAARAEASGRATVDQNKQVAGLDAEIAASPIVLQAGQMLFHGRVDTDLVTKQHYPTYVSTTLNAVVACNSAFRRAGVDQVNGRALVFVLTLRVPLPALWGQVGRSVEWELLLPRHITWRETGRTNGDHFDTVEAEAI
jgi:hypothetical protein